MYNSTMNKSVVTKARDLMARQTKRNGAPAWALTEIAVNQGKFLAKRYKVDQNVVSVSLYLAHTIFSTEIKGEVQRNHESLSADFAQRYLKKWKVSEKERGIVVNSILCHHDKCKPTSLEAEVMKNAECFKFLTIKGCMALIHDVGTRGMSFEDAVEFAKYKANQKLGYISLSGVKAIAARSYKETMALLNSWSTQVRTSPHSTATTSSS
jgi:hypothetical protein